MRRNRSHQRLPSQDVQKTGLTGVQWLEAQFPKQPQDSPSMFSNLPTRVLKNRSGWVIHKRSAPTWEEFHNWILRKVPGKFKGLSGTPLIFSRWIIVRFSWVSIGAHWFPLMNFRNFPFNPPESKVVSEAAKILPRITKVISGVIFAAMHLIWESGWRHWPFLRADFYSTDPCLLQWTLHFPEHVFPPSLGIEFVEQNVESK